jgi:cis-3-alkyl-4-acyloxetan-2-one decarboxylase
VVMVHGNPTWSFYYRRLIQSLSSRFRVIAPDHIGCGLSEKPKSDRYSYTLSRRVADFSRFIDYLELRGKITLVVHDWGGMIAMTWAVEHPERIARIIILNTAAFLPPKNKALPLRLWLVRNIKWISAPAILGLNLFAFSALYMAVNHPLSKEIKSGLIAPYNSWNHRIATLRFVFDIPVHPTDDGYALVKSVDNRLEILRDLPILICWGAKDFVFDLDYYNEWRKRFPAAESFLFQNAGHYVLEDVPEQVIDRVERFMATSVEAHANL